MTKGLQVGFGSPIGADLLADLRERGVQMARLDCQGVQSADDMAHLTAEVLAADLCPLLIIRPDQAAWWPPGAEIDIEILNEPDLNNTTPMDYATSVQRVCGTIPAGYRLWAGAISNLDLDSLAWLKASIRYWPESVGVSVHRYPPNGARPEQAHKGFGSRTHEVARLKAMIGARPWGVSEVGYHTGEQSTGWWFWRKRWHWTPDQVAEFMRWEGAFFDAQGAAFCCAYQINSGQTDHYLDQFGWRTVDGAWTPVADIYRAT